MHPAAEDNYGTDACNILCLETRPPVLVIATSEGKLHHCLLLNQPLDEDGNEDNSAAAVGFPHLFDCAGFLKKVLTICLFISSHYHCWLIQTLSCLHCNRLGSLGSSRNPKTKGELIENPCDSQEMISILVVLLSS